MNTSKSLNELVCGFLHPDKPDNVTAKEMLDLMEPGLVPAIVEAVEGIYGDSDGLREFASTGSNQADNLLVLAAEGSGNEFAMGYDDSGCFWRFYAGSRGAGSMMGEPVYHSESPEPLEALREYLQNYLGVTDLVATDKEARNG